MGNVDGARALDPNAAMVLKVLAIICGALICIMGVFAVWGAGEAMGNAQTADFVLQQLQAIIIGLTLILFGVLIFVSEFKGWSIIKYFGFMFSFFGKGCFMIYAGMIILPYGCPFNGCDFPEFGLVVGIICIVLGTIHLMIGCCFKHGQTPQPTYTA